MSGRTFFYFGGRCGRTSRSGARARAKMRSSPPPRPLTRTTSSWPFPAAMTRLSGSTDCNSPAVSASASLSRARCLAMLQDAPFILLDEATASLDSESERQVQGAIEHLCQGRTNIVIAHRLHTVVDADRIFVIEDGAVVEAGRHDELLRRGGRYTSFY